jgi:hypothetical protein
VAPIFVGRWKELSTAGSLFERARADSEAVCCLEAGPGMGKTALA